MPTTQAMYSIRLRRRTLDWKTWAFSWIAAMVMGSYSLGWLCQSVWGSKSGGLPGMGSSLGKALDEHGFQSMDLHGDGAGGQAADLPDRRGVETFEIEQHDLPV